MLTLQCFEQCCYVQLLQYCLAGGLAILPGLPTGELHCFAFIVF